MGNGEWGTGNGEWGGKGSRGSRGSGGSKGNRKRKMNHNHKQRKSQGTINTHQVHCHDALTQATASPLVGRSMLPNRVQQRYGGAGVLQVGGIVQRFERRRVESPQALGTVWSNRGEQSSAVGVMMGKTTIQRLVRHRKQEESMPDPPSSQHHQSISLSEKNPSEKNPSEQNTIKTIGLRVADRSSSIAHSLSLQSAASLPPAIDSFGNWDGSPPEGGLHPSPRTDLIKTRQVNQSATLSAAAAQFHHLPSVRQGSSIRPVQNVQAAGKIVQAKPAGRRLPLTGLEQETGVAPAIDAGQANQLLSLATPTNRVQTAGRTIQAKVRDPGTTETSIAVTSGIVGDTKVDKTGGRTGERADLRLAEVPDPQPTTDAVVQTKEIGSDASAMMPFPVQMTSQRRHQEHDAAEERLHISALPQASGADLPIAQPGHSLLQSALPVQTKTVQSKIEDEGVVNSRADDSDSMTAPRHSVLLVANNANMPIQKRRLRHRETEAGVQPATDAAADNSSRQTSAPNAHESSSRTVSSVSAAVDVPAVDVPAVDVQRIAEQVSRILTRQLAVERERRGISRWYS